MSAPDVAIAAALPILLGGALILIGLLGQRIGPIWRRRAEVAGRMLVALGLLYATLDAMTRALAHNDLGGVAAGLGMIVLASVIASPLYGQNSEEKTE